MRTIVFKLKDISEDKQIIKSLQKDYSQDFRKLYNNLELCADKNFLNSLKNKNVRFRENIILEVKSFYDKQETFNKKKIKQIKELESYNIDSNSFKKIVKLKRQLKKDVCFGGKNNLIKRTKGLISNENFKELRLYSMVYYGETSKKGNRFFDFRKLSSGEILFKPSKNIKISLIISNKKHTNELNQLEYLSQLKQIPITIKLSYDEIHISYDESILNNTYFDYKLFQKNKPIGLNKEETKNYWFKKHRTHEDYLKQNKLERFLAIDINPNEIGFCITDNNLNILDKGSYFIKGKIDENLRKYNYSIIIKELFNKVKHYKVSYFVIEDLDINKDNYGNRVSNRKIKLEMKKNFIFSLIQRRCNETGTILRKVNPCYSSFIGNLTFKELDSIASSLEICRRGVQQYTKGFKLIPEFNKDNIFTDKIDKYVDLNYYKGFIELFKSIRNKSYRRKEISFSIYKFNKQYVCLCL